MLLALHGFDYGVLAVFLLVMLGIGAYFSREQKTSQDFFLAGRSMGWFPVGLSIMATLLSALSYTGIPGEAYYMGLMPLLNLGVIWLTAPLMMRYILPLYRGLGLASVYEYLELRFDERLRLLGSVLFVFWRLLWLGGVIYAPCKVLVVAAGLPVPEWVLLLTLGIISTLYTYLGGMKAVLWTDVIQSLVMVAGVLFVIVGVWYQMDDGPSEVWEVAGRLQRTEMWDLRWDLSERWPIWGILPHFFFSMVSFYIADQITVQRYLTARDVPAARKSFVLNCISVSIMLPALVYVGISLLAFYQQQPNQMRPIWVANLDSTENRQPLTASDSNQPLLDWRTDGPALDPGTGSRERLEQILSEGRLIRPNAKEPYTVDDLETLWDEERQGVRADKLGMRDRDGEWVLNKQAKDELFPRFITRHLPFGVAGLILAALLAASMSSMDSGLNSITTLLITDYHRRLGWGRAWLARRRGKSVEELTEADELWLGRIAVLLIGVAATLCSMFVGRLGSIFDIMVEVINTFGGPLTAIFLLGIFTRRATARGALAGLISGMLFTLWLMAANNYESFRFLWPWSKPLNGVWSVTLGVVVTFALGYFFSVVFRALGERAKSRDELRGLVNGIGNLGERDAEMASIEIVDPDAKDPRWKG